MSDIHFAFDRQKAIEAILYIAQRAHEPSMHGIGKILYASDKASLEKYGRFICGDSYFAMKWGPVPSGVYDMMNHEGDGRLPFVRMGEIIHPARPANLDEFSKSDIECLNAGIEIVGDDDFAARHENSSDAAYKKAWGQRGNNLSVPMDVEDIAKLLKHSEELIDHLTHNG